MQISMDGFSEEIMKLLEEYGEEAEKAVEEAITEVAKESKKALNQASPRGRGTKKGHYGDGWSYKVEKGRLGNIGAQAYNTKKPQLTHLLENGHATKNGTGRSYPDTPAHPHIEDVNEKAQTDVVDKIENKLGM